MKSIYLSLIFILLALTTAVQAQEKQDTLVSKSNIDEVVISESKNNISVSIKGKDATGEYSKEYNSVLPDGVSVTSNQWERRGYTNFKICASDTTRHWLNEIVGGGSLLLGFMTTTDTPNGMKLNHGRLSELSWLDIVSYRAQLKNSSHSFSVGFGLSWRSFPLLNSQTYTISDGKVGFADYQGSSTLKRSRLKVFSLSVPVLWNWKFCRKHTLKLGPIVNFNTHASLKTTMKNGDTESALSTNDISKRPVTVDLYGAIEISGDFGLFVRYSPMNIFKTGATPTMRPLSFGFQFGF